MRKLYPLLWLALSGLTWYEAWLIRNARQVDGSSIALREREWASVSRASALSIGGVLGLNRLIGTPISDRHSRVLLSAALSLNALPAVRFIYLYRTRGFK